MNVMIIGSIWLINVVTAPLVGAVNVCPKPPLHGVIKCDVLLRRGQ